MTYLAVLVALILTNGLFAMAEIALVTARKSRLQRLADDGDRAAARALRLGAEPTRFLSTIQIGITAIGLLSGIVGEAVFAESVTGWLTRMGMSERAAPAVATVGVVAAITYLSIVFGELVPKRLAQLNAEGLARFLSAPVALLALLSRPFVYVLTKSTDGLLRLLGAGRGDNELVTEEDIHALLADGSEAGVIEKSEHEMVRNVFRLDDRQIASLMTPRSEIVFLDLEQPLDRIREAMREHGHSRFPVCRGGLDKLQGVVSAKQLLELRGEEELRRFVDRLAPPVFVPESMSGMRLLEQFRESGVKMVFVVDEYGEILGLVTLHNVLVALAGEFKPRDPGDVWAFRRDDGSWFLDGLIPVPVLKDRLDLKTVPDEDKSRYNTLAGMILYLMGRVPRTGDWTDWEGWHFEVADLDGNRIDKVLATRLEPLAKPDE